MVLIPEQSRIGSAFSRTRACALCCSVLLTSCPRGSARLAAPIRAALVDELGARPARPCRGCGRRSSCWGWDRRRRGKMDLALLLAALLGLLIVKALLFQRRNPSSPPCIRSWIPWFGAAFQFGKAPLEFIEQARNKVMRALACLLVGACSGWLPARGKATRNFCVQFCLFLSRFITSGAFKW